MSGRPSGARPLGETEGSGLVSVRPAQDAGLENREEPMNNEEKKPDTENMVGSHWVGICIMLALVIAAIALGCYDRIQGNIHPYADYERQLN